ncbi:MAG: NUDIX hydrolase [Proteobacteria bacterium]|nr:NUDIX hydrolase [Pseudomonadota bacterium]
MAEPDWLIWTRELQAIAQTGIAFTKDPYDRQRYDALRTLASRIMAGHCDATPERIAALFAAERGYATPKAGVRGAVFDTGGRLLMVRETEDGGRWTMPGGWAEPNLTPAENVVREVWEESGYEVRVRKLAAVWDRGRQGHPPSAFSVYRFFFICDLIGGAPRTSLETSEIGWFAEHELPDDLSVNRVLPHQVRRMFAHARDESLPTEFD